LEKNEERVCEREGGSVFEIERKSMQKKERECERERMSKKRKTET
jgi:hypothetical protein